MSPSGQEGFGAFIASLGFEPPKLIEPGRWTPFSANGKHGNTAGRARLFPDCEGGIVFDWRTGESWTWQAKRDRPQTEAERTAWREKIERGKREAEAEREREARATAERAAKIWAEAKPADDSHAYLMTKGVKSHGLRIYRGPLALNAMRCDGALIVPMRTVAGDLVSLQFIAPSGEKRYLAGPRAPGSYFSIGKPSDVLCIAEGYATAATDHEAAGHAVAVAFDAGNLEPTAKALRSKFSDARLILCADDDWRTKRPDGTPCNPGIEAATNAARAVGGFLAVPVFGPERGEGDTDFNDLARLYGASAVVKAIQQAKSPDVPRAQPIAADRSEPVLEAPQSAVSDEPQGNVAPAPFVAYRSYSEIEARPIDWLWPDKIARGKLTVIAGNPGLGKSQVTCFLASVVTTGGTWPARGGRCDRGSVIYLSAEDDPEDTIKPRLQATGADISRCYNLDAIVEGYSSDGAERRRSFNLQADLSRLEKMIQDIGDVRLAVVDPISAYLGDANSHNNAEVRALLSPLSDLAARRGVAIVAVSHLNKGGSNEAIMRVTGSLAFVAASRAAYVVVQDKEDEYRRLFLSLKNNIGPGGSATGLAFKIEGITVPSNSGPINSSRVEWEPNAVSITAAEAMAPALDPEDRTELDDAKAFLLGVLADGGAVPVRQIQADANANAHSWATVRRAQKALGVVPKKGGMKEGWTWRLPPGEPPKALKNPEDAHDSGLSTFGGNEHLRPGSAPSEDAEVL